MPDPSQYQHPPGAHRTIADVGIVGGGRVGTVLARALSTVGYRVLGPSGRGEMPPAADIILLCVPDREIPGAAAAAAGRARLVGHTSGATPLDHVDFGTHPLQTIRADDEPAVLAGVGCAVAGRTPDAVAVAYELTEALRMRPFPIADEHRAAYHAAAAFASNFLVTLEAAAERMLSVAVPDADARALLAPLVRRTVENWAADGPEAALTGPIARGDEQTVAWQRAAVAAEAAELIPLFDVLADSTRALARRSR
ncbi:DUF2520 domain-containing protein [Microbacterium sp. SYP-A9085]|uniref:DUF2520 domain-containing protein n=1 Tax=Microbacterium sp. SYP-A9085 TaxID=2664454 RepID=UPI00129A61C5|nr:DUF2520 domain-containing protein [Microbacterium sp. SYP-A9085]MRH30071.1 DUF2520 domain-containing protein [Microbacterium sp. SYP-A9085]